MRASTKRALAIGQVADVDRDHTVGAHAADDVRGNVVHRAAVDEHARSVTGGKISGSDIVARIARASEPRSSTTKDAVRRSTATQRNGISRRLTALC